MIKADKKEMAGGIPEKLLKFHYTFWEGFAVVVILMEAVHIFTHWFPFVEEVNLLVFIPAIAAAGIIYEGAQKREQHLQERPSQRLRLYNRFHAGTGCIFLWYAFFFKPSLWIIGLLVCFYALVYIALNFAIIGGKTERAEK